MTDLDVDGIVARYREHALCRDDSEHSESADDVPELLAEVERLRRAEAYLTGQCDRARTDAERLSREEARVRKLYDRAESERRQLSYALWRVRTVKCWTNEDGKRFVFADDLAAAVDAEEAAPGVEWAARAVRYDGTAHHTVGDEEYARLVVESTAMHLGSLDEATRRAGGVERVELVRREVREWPDGSRWTGPWATVEVDGATEAER
jgi:hypothetical protein